MSLPNFIIFGTRKAGTTSLYHYLSQHPEIYMTPHKGTRYFLSESELIKQNNNSLVNTLEEYSKLFSDAKDKNAKAIGEASPSYMYSKVACERIKESLPNVKLIASLRNPIDITYSYYQMQMRRVKPKEQVKIDINNVIRWSDPGLYFKYLRRYFEVFNNTQIKIVIFEEWIKQPYSALMEIFQFLEVDEKFVPNLSIQYNTGGFAKNKVIAYILRNKDSLSVLKPYVPEALKMQLNKIISKNMKKLPPLNSELRQYLQEYYREDVLSLQDMINKDLSIWLNEEKQLAV